MRNKNLVFYILILFLPSISTGQNIENELIKADSLFKNKKFIQSLELYNNIQESGKSSQSMLLKMAYIHEGLENYPKALYYLSKLNKSFPSEALEYKIQSMAVNHDINGFEKSDQEILYSYFKRGISIARLVLIVVMCLLFTLFFINTKAPKKLLAAFIFTVILWSASGFLNFHTNTVVIWKKNTYALSDASSASKVIDILPLGQRFIVQEINNIWVELKDDEQSIFVKKSNLKFI